jgi:hypothetical protein
MDLNIVCKPSAFKHGIEEADIRNAFKMCLFDHAIPDEEHNCSSDLIATEIRLRLYITSLTAMLSMN